MKSYTILYEERQRYIKKDAQIDGRNRCRLAESKEEAVPNILQKLQQNHKRVSV